MKPLSFRTRISIGFCSLLVLALLSAFFAIRPALQEGLQNETRQSAVQQLKMVAWLITEHPPFSNEAEFDTWITDLGKHLGYRITFIVDGQVLADSTVTFKTLPQLEDHSTRPEVIQAQEKMIGMNIRRSATLKRELMYVAEPVAAVSGLPAGILRLAVPVSELQQQYQRIASPLWWILLFTLLGAALLSILLSRGLMRSVRDLSETAIAIGKGDYAQRIRFYPGEEFKPLVDSLNTMAENINQTVQELDAGKHRLETLFNAMSDGVLALDGQARIESWNNAMAQLYPEITAATGRRPLEVLPEPELHAAINRLMESHGPETSLRVHCRIHGEKHFDVRIERIPGQETPPRLLLVFRDITEQKRLENMRRDFVTNVSHELKTPITSILGYVETLLHMPLTQDDEANDRNRSFLEIIQRNAQHMHGMVLRLIALSKAEHAAPPAQLQAVRPRVPLQRALSTLDTMLRKKDIRIVEKRELEDVRVLAEEEGLEDVFRNLVENAVKFGPAQQTITIGATREGDTVSIYVQDQGPGIPSPQQGRIFERFYRGQSGPSSKDGSAGLGLSICRNMLERYHGVITVQSPPQDGTTSGARFTFTLNAA